MASKANPGNRGTTQTGYGKHADRRTKRLRTREAQEQAAVDEFWKAMELGEAYARFDDMDDDDE